MHLLLRNSHIISPAQGINGRFDLLIINGVINRMGVVWQHAREVIEFDLSGKIVAPGLFDMHVHFREPGQTHKEDIKTGSLSAAFGGFTGVLCMPNTSPPVDSPDILKENSLKASDNIVSVFSAACATKGRKGENVSDIKALVKAGAVAVTDDGSPVNNALIMKEVLTLSAAAGVPMIQHCEDPLLSAGGVVNEGIISKRLRLKGISSESEYRMIERDIGLMREIKGSHYHVQHISTAEGVRLVRKAKNEGLNVTSEACPHHFTLTENAVLEYGANAKMNPPLRTADDVDEIIRGLKDGTIDVICSDHAPHTEDEKKLGTEGAPFGITGLETSLGLAYTFLVERGVITLEEMIVKMSENPRKILNLPAVKIKEGEIANLTIIDAQKEWKVDPNKFHSKGRNTPFTGWLLKGKPAGVVNNTKHMIYE